MEAAERSDIKQLPQGISLEVFRLKTEWKGYSSKIKSVIVIIGLMLMLSGSAGGANFVRQTKVRPDVSASVRRDVSANVAKVDVSTT
jgi:hypothetical protein